MVKADFALFLVLGGVQDIGLQVDIFELLQRYRLPCSARDMLSFRLRLTGSRISKKTWNI